MHPRIFPTLALPFFHHSTPSLFTHTAMGLNGFRVHISLTSCVTTFPISNCRCLSQFITIRISENISIPIVISLWNYNSSTHPAPLNSMEYKLYIVYRVVDRTHAWFLFQKSRCIVYAYMGEWKNCKVVIAYILTWPSESQIFIHSFVGQHFLSKSVLWYMYIPICRFDCLSVCLFIP